MIQGGLTHMPGGQLGMSAQHFQSHGLSRKKCRLLMWPVQCFKRSRMEATQSPEPESEVTVSLMLHSVSQSKSQSQSRLKGWGKWILPLDGRSCTQYVFICNLCQNLKDYEKTMAKSSIFLSGIIFFILMHFLKFIFN